MSNQIVVLAGGLATRLYPITEKIPKAMVEVAGKPFFSHQIELFKKNGITNIVMCIGHLGEQIEAYYGDGKKFGVSIVYSKEDKKLDTGGAIKNALPYLDETFFVIYGDAYLLCDYQKAYKFFEKNDGKGLMMVYQNNNQLEPSRVLLDGIYVKKYQKDPPPKGAKFMEFGLNILPRSIIDVPGEVFPISVYFDILAEEGKLLAFESSQRFYEIGCAEGLKLTNEILSESKNAAKN